MRPDAPGTPGRIAVALHDVEPATFERCALIRDWLDDQGVARATLLVVPAGDLHPFHDRRPELADWLAERCGAGDRVAMHGFQHRAQGSRAEFAGLGEDDARRAIAAGRRVLRLAGIQARGFVAPGYAYTGALSKILAGTFEWWASGSAVHGDGGRRTTRSPALHLARPGAAGLLVSPLALRLAGRLGGPLLRLDLHPGDFDKPRHVGAVERVLRDARRRMAVTYDELGAAATA